MVCPGHGGTPGPGPVCTLQVLPGPGRAAVRQPRRVPQRRARRRSTENEPGVKVPLRPTGTRISLIDSVSFFDRQTLLTAPRASVAGSKFTSPRRRSPALLPTPRPDLMQRLLHFNEYENENDGGRKREGGKAKDAKSKRAS